MEESGLDSSPADHLSHCPGERTGGNLSVRKKWEGTQSKKKGFFIFSYCLAFLLFPVLLSLSLSFFAHSFSSPLGWMDLLFTALALDSNVSLQCLFDTAEQNQWQTGIKAALEKICWKFCRAIRFPNMSTISSFAILITMLQSLQIFLPFFFLKKKGYWLNKKSPYTSWLILLHSSKHCKRDGQFWWLSVQHLRHFYPTDQMMVTDWCKFATGGYLSYTYGDLLHIPIHSRIISWFHFFFKLDPKRSWNVWTASKEYIFSAKQRWQQIWILVSLELSKIVLVTGWDDSAAQPWLFPCSMAKRLDMGISSWLSVLDFLVPLGEFFFYSYTQFNYATWQFQKILVA